MSILNWLKKPYFFNSNPNYHLKVSFLVGCFIFLFIYAFKPFGMAVLENNLFLYSLGFGCVTFFVETFLFVLIPLVFKDFFKDESWTVGKNIAYLLILVTCISIGNWFYNSKVQITHNSGLLTLPEIFSYTFSVAIFPIFIYTYLSELYYSSKKKTETKIIEDLKEVSFKEEIKIYGNNKKENISIKTEKLVYITSQKNYVSFIILTNKGLKEYLLRNTLSNISKQLETYSNFIRCHKSYLVNIDFFDAYTGNSRGYFLESDVIENKIPISRNFSIEKINNIIAKN